MKTTRANDYNVVWNWFGNTSTEQNERFATREAAWKKVQALMALESSPWDGAPLRKLCYINVYSDRTPDGGVAVAAFRVYEKGCKYDKWNGWGVENYRLTGESFG